MKGKKLAPHTRMMINPGLARNLLCRRCRKGLIEIMVEAGATIGVPGCGPCSGCHQGMLAPAENAITNASRNFKGRFGSPGGERLCGVIGDGRGLRDRRPDRLAGRTPKAH